MKKATPVRLEAVALMGSNDSDSVAALTSDDWVFWLGNVSGGGKNLSGAGFPGKLLFPAGSQPKFEPDPAPGDSTLAFFKVSKVDVQGKLTTNLASAAKATYIDVTHRIENPEINTQSTTCVSCHTSHTSRIALGGGSTASVFRS